MVFALGRLAAHVCDRRDIDVTLVACLAELQALAAYFWI
jgi:hypothetical protein